MDEAGNDVSRGGTVRATGLAEVDFGAALTITAQSSVRTDATGEGALTATNSSLVRLNGSGIVNIFGLVESVDNGSDVSIATSSLIVVDGFIQANDILTLKGGSHTSGAGILVQPLVLQTDGSGHFVDENGDLIDEAGFLINDTGAFVDGSGSVIPDGSDPIPGGQSVRLSGGTLNTGAGNRIILTAEDDVVVHGTVGELSETGGELIPDVSEIQIVSNRGNVSVTGRMDSRDAISMSGNNVNVLAGGSVKVRGSGAEIFARANEKVFVAAAAGETAAGLVEASSGIHFYADGIRIDGLIRNKEVGGRVLLNGVTAVDLMSTVTSLGNIEVNAGVGSGWTIAQLASGTIRVSDLSGGIIRVMDGGVVDAGADTALVAGGNVFIEGTSELQPELATVLVPIIKTEASTIEVVTGFLEVADGVIQVPEVVWVTTVVTEQVGTDEIKVGSFFRTMDVTLVQDGYYNADAATADRLREFFIEGVDYYNGTDSPSGVVSGIPVIDWAAFSITDIPVSDFSETVNYKTFAQLSDAQRNAVLSTLGYMPLYDFAYFNPQEHKTLEGNVTVTPWTPDWDVAVSTYAAWSDWVSFENHQTNDSAAFGQLLQSMGYTEVIGAMATYYQSPIVQPEAEVFIPDSSSDISQDLVDVTGWTLSGNASHDSSNGKIILTPNTTGQAGLAVFDTAFSTSEGLLAEFDYFSGNGNGADGMAFILVDGAADTLALGPAGGFLGYIGSSTTSGMPSGYLALGFDEFGGFATVATGGPTDLVTDVVTIVGSGDGTNEDGDYRYLVRQGVGSLGGIDGGSRRVRVSLTPSEFLTVEMSWDGGSTWNIIIDSFDVGEVTGQAALPSTVKLAFTGSTGGATNEHSVDNLKVNALTNVRTRLAPDNTWSQRMYLTANAPTATALGQSLLNSGFLDGGAGTYRTPGTNQQIEFAVSTAGDWNVRIGANTLLQATGLGKLSSSIARGSLLNAGYVQGNADTNGTVPYRLPQDQVAYLAVNMPGETVNPILSRTSTDSGATWSQWSTPTDYQFLARESVAGFGGVDGGWRDVRVTLTDTQVLTVEMSWDATTWKTIVDHMQIGINGDQVPLPGTLKLGFTGATSGGTNTHRIDNVVVTTSADQVLVNEAFADVSAWTLSGHASHDAGNANLVLTPNLTDQLGLAVLNTALSTGSGLKIEFDYYAGDGTGADGVALVLVDGATGTVVPGIGGGNIGYFGSDTVSGMNNAYLAVGFDEFGNFATAANGGPTALADTITVIGSANYNRDDFVNTLTGGGFTQIAATIYRSPKLPTQTDFVVVDLPNQSKGAVLQRTRQGDSALFSVNKIDVAGWSDKYIRMPIGAEKDALRVVSQGEPGTFQENAGAVRELATVKYVQDRSTHETFTKVVNNFTVTVTDTDNSPARWLVSYDSNGKLEYSIADGRTIAAGNADTYVRPPDWFYETAFSENVNDLLGRNVKAPVNYLQSTLELLNETLNATHSNVEVGLDPRATLGPRTNLRIVEQGLFGSPFGWRKISDTNEGQIETWEHAFRDGFLNSRWNRERATRTWNEGPVVETQQDFTYDWKSVWSDVLGTRSTLQYQWVSVDADIFGKRPRLETFETEVKTVEQKTVTTFKTEPVIEEQTVFTTKRLLDEGDPLPFGAFETDTIRAGGAVSILTGADVGVSGRIRAEAGLLDINAGGGVSVAGLVPVGSATNTLAALS
ncbi:MAG TPA: hypothetical protein EYG03_25395, partial [Planctomycetes bacterium]|nr:hypothetical protein [Planctomycetota bacterium]